MATTIISQRDRNAVLVETPVPPVLTTNTPCRGLVFDGRFLWASAGAELVQFSTKPITVLKTIASTPAETYDDLSFDGEYLYGPVSANAGLGQIERTTATRVNFIGSITTAGPRGITWDGEFHWGLYLNGLTGTYFIFQTDHLYQGIITQFNTGLTEARGLVFDGEFLVTATTIAGNVQLVYFDRTAGTAVFTTTGGAGAGGDANGLAYDGEFFYTMLSV